MDNFFVIDGVEFKIPDGYEIKINYNELGKSVLTLSGNYVKDTQLPIVYTFSLKWDIIDGSRVEQVMDIYDKCNNGSVVSFKYYFHDNSYHIKTDVIVDNLKMGEVKSSSSLWLYRGFSFDIL